MSRESVAELKERIKRQGAERLKQDMENDALREQVATLNIQLWEARNVIAAYRSAHIQSLQQEEE